MSNPDPRNDPDTVLNQLHRLGKFIHRVKRHHKTYGKKRGSTIQKPPRSAICQLRHLILHVERYLP